MPRTLTAALLAFASSCATVSEPPRVDAEVRVLSQHVFRGVSQTDGKALQALSAWAVDLGEGQRFRLGSFMNADGTNDSGDGVFPDGNGGQITRVELEPTWIWDLHDGTFSAAVVNRSYPNIDGYGDTNEAKLRYALTAEFFGMRPVFSAYYDLEDGDGLYTQVGLVRGWELEDGLSLETAYHLAYADKDQSALLYGADEAGFADLTAEAVMRWRYTPTLDITGTLAGSTLVSSALADSLKAAGRDDANLWLGVGLRWMF
ncbi:MAG: hypothetical protein MK297_07235 [Planctomycetes bacterium]|nr:hypothetical protein [Planctomycetota bacterium]